MGADPRAFASVSLLFVFCLCVMGEGGQGTVLQGRDYLQNAESLRGGRRNKQQATANRDSRDIHSQAAHTSKI